MSIFDDNDNSLAKFNQLVQLAKNVASFQDTTQEDWRIQQQLYQQETREQNQLKSRHDGIVNAFNNTTTKLITYKKVLPSLQVSAYETSLPVEVHQERINIAKD